MSEKQYNSDMIRHERDIFIYIVCNMFYGGYDVASIPWPRTEMLGIFGEGSLVSDRFVSCPSRHFPNAKWDDFLHVTLR